MPRMRGRLYSSCASSTWSLPSALTACWAKMSRISCVRSIDARLRARPRGSAAATGSSSSSTSRLSASASSKRCLQLLELALADVGALRRARRGAARRGRPARRRRCARAPRSRRAPRRDRPPAPGPRGRTRAPAPGNVESSGDIMPASPAGIRPRRPDARARRHPLAVARRGRASTDYVKRHARRCRRVYDDGESLLYAKRAGRPLVLLAGPHRHRPGAGQPARAGSRTAPSTASARRDMKGGLAVMIELGALGRSTPSSPTTSACSSSRARSSGPSDNPLPARLRGGAGRRRGGARRSASSRPTTRSSSAASATSTRASSSRAARRTRRGRGSASTRSRSRSRGCAPSSSSSRSTSTSTGSSSARC